MTHNLRRRTAFTLVEMLVASALIIFMMYVMASAFEKGLESFRVMKVQGDMQDKLRAAATILRLDLTAPHFGDGKSLSDQRLNDQFWQPPKKGYFRMWLPGGAGVNEGIDPDGVGPMPYYRITTPSPGSASASNPNTVKDLYLQFTVNLTDGHPSVRDARGRRDQFLMTDTSPDNTLNRYSTPDYNIDGSTSFTSYWAEVTYFAKPNGKFTDGLVPLFDVYRRQKLLVEPAPPNPYPLTPTASGNFNDVSIWPLSQQQIFNGSADVTEPFRRWGMLNAPTPAQTPVYGKPASGLAPNALAPFQTILDEALARFPSTPYADPLLGQRIGGDILLTNVVNFEVKVLWEPVRLGAPNTARFFLPNGAAAAPTDTMEPSAMNNPDYPFDQLPYGINQSLSPPTNPLGTYAPRVFDTWSSNRDTDPNHNPPQYDYNYGVDRTIYPATGPLAGPQPGLSTDPNFANWNIGHFAPLPGIPPANTGASTPTGYTIPLRVRVRALQIKLRIWDLKTSQTRQITIIQDM